MRIRGNEHIVLGATLLLLSLGLSGQQEYTIKAGRKNFWPPEKIWPRHFADFHFKAAFDSTCYFSHSDWQYDGDWHDWNKLFGRTAFFTANNKNSNIIAFRPSDEDQVMEVGPYTNGAEGSFEFEDRSNVFRVHTGEWFENHCSVVGDSAFYTIWTATDTLSWTHTYQKSRWPFFRDTGTWMGGRNNDKKGLPFGGEASQPMRLWIKAN